MSFTASCKSRWRALFRWRRSFSAINVPPKAANSSKTTWKRPDLLTMTCWLPDMMLNFDGAAAFLSSSPMVGDARAAALCGCCQGGFPFLCRQRTRGGFWACRSCLDVETIAQRWRLVSVRCAGVVLRRTNLSIFWLSKHGGIAGN